MVAADANVQIKDQIESIKTISYLCHLDNVIQETKRIKRCTQTKQI